MDSDFDRLNPKLIFANHIGTGNVPQGMTTFGSRVTRWHELDIITWGEGVDHVDGTSWPVTGGDLFYRTPGMHNRSDLPYTCYFFVFDPWFDESRVTDYRLGAAQRIHNPHAIPQPPIALFSVAERPYLGKARDLPKLLVLCRNIMAEYASTRPDPMLLKILFLQLLHEVAAQTAPAEEFEIPPSTYRQYWQEIRDLRQWIRDNPTEDLSMDRMAQRMGLSYSFFSRLFKSITGETFSSFVSRMKLDYVRSQLIDTDKSVARIALDCGFRDPNYLYILFRRAMGCTPTEYRRFTAAEQKAPAGTDHV